MNKVLIVTYYWPPGSGAGVQRWLKFSKYMPSFGFEPVILTVEPGYATYPAIDNTLQDEISDELKIIRTKATDWFRIYKKDKSGIPSAGFATDDANGIKDKIIRFVRGNFFIPDPRRGWNKYALREACRLIESEQIKYLITTSPPHSTQLIGLKLKKKYPGIKWIADLRDPWTDIYYYDQFYHTPLARRIDRYYEKLVLGSADRIITVGKTLKELFSLKIPRIENKSEVIPNGYDESDFESIKPLNPAEFTISYIGTLSDSYPLSGFLDALASFVLEGLKVRLKFIGVVSPIQKSLILAKTVKSSVDFIAYADHKTAITYMMESSALLLIIPDHISNRSIITGKIFEYLASGKPVLCIGPVDGDAAEIIESSKHGMCAAHNDPVRINYILKSFHESRSDSPIPAPAEFSRKYLTGILVKQF